MQIQEIALGFILNGLALILAIASVFVSFLLLTRENIAPHRKTRAFHWGLFLVFVTALHVLSASLMVASGRYPEYSGIVTSYIILGFSGFVSLIELDSIKDQHRIV